MTDIKTTMNFEEWWGAVGCHLLTPAKKQDALIVWVASERMSENIKASDELAALRAELAEVKQESLRLVESHKRDSDFQTSLIVRLRDEIATANQRERMCATMDECAKVVLVRGFQELNKILGLDSETNSMSDLVENVKRLNQRADQAEKRAEAMRDALEYARHDMVCCDADGHYIAIGKAVAALDAAKGE